MIGSGQFIYKKAVMPKYDGKKLTHPQIEPRSSKI